MSELAEIPSITTRPAQSVVSTYYKPISLERRVRFAADSGEAFDVVLGEREYRGPKEYLSDYTKAEIIATRASLSRDGIQTEIKTVMGGKRSLLLLVVRPPERAVEGEVVK